MIPYDIIRGKNSALTNTYRVNVGSADKDQFLVIQSSRRRVDDQEDKDLVHSVNVYLRSERPDELYDAIKNMLSETGKSAHLTKSPSTAGSQQWIKLQAPDRDTVKNAFEMATTYFKGD